MRSTRLWASSKEKHPLLAPALLVAAVGIGYFALVQLTGISLFCPFQKLTGLACPGCGVTHLCARLVKGDPAAFGENWGITLAATLWLITAGITLLRRRHILGITKEKPVQAVTWGCIGLLLLFGVVRNLPGFTFLLPSYMR